MPRRKRRLAARIRDWLRQLLAFLFSNVGVIVLVVVYTIAGACIFQAIEGAGEMERENHMMRERDNTAQYLWQNVTLTLNLFNETELKRRIKLELKKYQGKVVVAVRRGWDGGKSSRQWSFSSAFLYSLTVITTIGYGHLSPRTTWGKVSTVLYALLGMPLFLLYLSNLGELLARWFKWLYALVCLCRGCPGLTRRRVARHRAQMELSEPESIERPAPYSGPEDRMPAEYYGPRRHEDYRRPDDHTIPRRPDDYTIPPYRRPNDFVSPYQIPTNYTSSRRLENYAPPYRRPGDYMYPRRQEDFTSPSRRPEDYTSSRRPVDYTSAYRRPEDYMSQRRLEDYAPPYRRPEDNMSPRRPEDYASPYRRPVFRSWTVPPSRWPAVDESPVTSEFSYITFDAQTITVPISVCVFIMVGYIMFGSMIFGKWEEWDQLDGAYFCFISLSSIGFGDFVPGERIYTARIETSFIVCSLYLMLGMALVAMCFNLMQEQVIHYFAGLKRALKRICRCCKR